MLGVCVALPSTTLAQLRDPTGGIAGRIVDHESRAPIGGARIALLGTPRRTSSDSAGRFTHARLAPGTYILEARAIGYGASSWVIRLAEGQVLDHEFELTPLGYELNPVVVEARPSLAKRRMQEFEERRQARRGVFLTAEQIRQTKASTLVDVLHDVAGVRTVCRGRTCTVRMSRSRECAPNFFVDGFPANNSMFLGMPLVGVIGIEIYRTESETPVAFLRGDNVCGAIVIWTKSGP